MIAIANYIANVPELSEEYAELARELSRNAEKAAANRELYDAARDSVLETLKLASASVTATELYESCEDKLPEGFTKGKLTYALNHYWNDAVNIEQIKGTNVYTAR